MEANLAHEYHILFFLVVFRCNYVIICLDKSSLMDMTLCILESFKINGITNQLMNSKFVL